MYGKQQRKDKCWISHRKHSPFVGGNNITGLRLLWRQDRGGCYRPAERNELPGVLERKARYQQKM